MPADPVLTFSNPPAVSEKEPTMKTEPQKEQEWLQKLVGEWTYEVEVVMEHGKSPECFRGTESV